MFYLATALLAELKLGATVLLNIEIWKYNCKPKAAFEAEVQYVCKAHIRKRCFCHGKWSRDQDFS